MPLDQRHFACAIACTIFVMGSCATNESSSGEGDGSGGASSIDAGTAGSNSFPNGSGGAFGGSTSGSAGGAAGSTNGGAGAAGGETASGGTMARDGGTSAGGSSACTATEQLSLDDGVTGTGDDEFEFAGGWATSTGSGKYLNGDHYSSTAAGTATLRFEGTRAALHSAKASHHGIAEVTLDGGAPMDVDLYAATRAEDVEVWNSGALAPGNHVLVVRVSGRSAAASTGTTVSVDRVVVERSACDGGAASGGASGDGGAASGGLSGAGGSGAGGASGAGGNGTVMSRPAYNTGTGFFVVGSKLYDPNGAEFRIRGVNKLHWDASSPGIPKTHSNTERWVIDFNQSSSTNLGLMKQSTDARIVPMPGNWAGTCDESTAKLTSIVDTWVAQASTWKTLERTMILNVANEWGPSGTAWRDAYITAIGRLRTAGYLSTISVTSGGCGQDNADLAQYAAAVFDSDPQKNVIFDQHIYGNWADGNGQSWQTDLNTGLDALVATGLPMIVGEFGPGRNIGPSATNMTPDAIIQACENRGIGWLAWAWDDPASNADDTWFALSKNGDYSSSADLTTFGKTVVENPTYGLLALARPATSL